MPSTSHTLLIAALAAAHLSSCSSGPTPEEEASVQTAVELARANTLYHAPSEILQQARTIRTLPVSRQRLTTAFQLENVPSKRSLTSAQEGVIDHTETWLLPNGLTLTAYNPQALPAHQYRDTLTQIRNDQAQSPQQRSFSFFVIKNPAGKTLYASLEQQDTTAR